MVGRRLASVTLSAIALSACAAGSSPMGPGGSAQATGSAERCRALGDRLAVNWPEAGTRQTGTVHREAGLEPPQPGPPGMAMPRASLPSHCDLTGVIRERKGVDGQDYAIRFHL